MLYAKNIPNNAHAFQFLLAKVSVVAIQAFVHCSRDRDGQVTGYLVEASATDGHFDSMAEGQPELRQVSVSLFCKRRQEKGIHRCIRNMPTLT